jgi:hypothetical protein
MYSSSTESGSMPATSTAPRIAVAPSRLACTEESVPPKLPIGVRAADKIKTSFFMILALLTDIFKNRNYSVNIFSKKG